MRGQPTSLIFLRLDVVSDDNREHDGDNGKDNEYDDEADPPLFSCSAGRVNGLVRVDNSGVRTLSTLECRGMHCIPCFQVLFDICRGRFYVVDHVILLLYHDTHLKK